MMFSSVPVWLLTDIDNSSSERSSESSQELEQWSCFSLGVHLLLPLAVFCVMWGHRDILSRLLLQIDRCFIAVFCPSLSKREKLLKWAGENLPKTWSSPAKTLSGGIPDLWKDGSLLCTLINMAIPGACTNPPKHWKKSPTHAQSLAYKYLGIVPVFTEKDFEESFSPTQERKFLSYLQELQQAIKTRSTQEGGLNFSSGYLAKGMGLHNGEQHKKTTFYIYSNTTNSNCNNILVYIRGPYGTQGTATIPAFHNLNSIPVLNYLHKQFKASDRIVYKKEARKSFLKSIALDFTSFVNLDKKILTNDIPIQVEMEFDRAKITYIPKNYGIYETNLISNGERLNGSPFLVSVSENTSGGQDSFESAEEIMEKLPSLKKKRIISRFIDCVDEKIYLNSSEDVNNNRRISIPKIASVSVVTDDGGSPTSKIPIGCIEGTLPHAIIQYENPLANDPVKPPLRTLEKIHEVENDVTDFDIKSQIVTYELIENNTTIPRKITKILNKSNSKIHDVPENKPETSQNIEKIKNEVAEIQPLPQNIPLADSQKTTDVCKNKNSAEKTLVDSDSSIVDNSNSKESVSIKLIHINEPEAKNNLSLSNKKIDNVQHNRPTSIVTPFTKNTQQEAIDINNDTLRIPNKNNNKHNTDTEITVKDQNDQHEFIIDISNNTSPSEQHQNNIDHIENIKVILMNKLKNHTDNTKVFKDLVNTTNQLKFLNKLQDENHIKPNPDSSIDTLETSISLNTTSTSPICPAHIVPEVDPTEPKRLSLSEKRKLLARQFQTSTASSTNSSISEKENERVQENSGSQKYSLRVLSVMETIKNATNSASHTLNRDSSKSVPNLSKSKTIDTEFIGSEDHESVFESRETFQKMKNFWKNKSLENCSLSSSTCSMLKEDISLRNNKVYIQDTSRKSVEMYRSADDISSVAEFRLRKRKLSRHSSLNQKDFQDIDFTSIEERKRKLFPEKYENKNDDDKCNKKNEVSKNDGGSLEKRDSSWKLEIENPSKLSGSTENAEENSIEEVSVKPVIEKETKFTSQFKRAITFFKNLEKTSSSKKPKKLDRKSKPPKLSRRFSLDLVQQKESEVKKGGSLHLPKATEKCSISKLYTDIIENKIENQNSKKIPTETGRNESELYNRYNMLMSKFRTKKRKNLKSIFDVNY